MAMFVVTGLGHSGTKWAALLFSALGHQCGHERWHNFRPYQGMATPDSSWLAVPNLDRLPTGTRVVHLVRDPQLVLQSALRIGFLHDGHANNPYSAFVRRRRPDVWNAGDQLARAVAYVARWDTPLEQRESKLLRVEDASPEVVADVVAWTTGKRPSVPRVAEVLRGLGTTTNAHARHGAPAGGHVKTEQVTACPHGGEFVARAERLGYHGWRCAGGEALAAGQARPSDPGGPSCPGRTLGR